MISNPPATAVPVSSAVGMQQVNAVRLRLLRACKYAANRWDTMDLVRLLGLPNQNTGTMLATRRTTHRGWVGCSSRQTIG